MKNVLLSVVLLVCVSSLQAQPPQGRQRMSVEERAKQTTEWMTTELNLTQEQVAPVDSINLLFTKAQQVVIQAADGDRDKMRENMTALDKEKETALSKVLTSEQLDTYKKKNEEIMEKFWNRRRAQ